MIVLAARKGHMGLRTWRASLLDEERELEDGWTCRRRPLAETKEAHSGI